MQIYVGKNGQQLGPFSLEEINRKLADGTFAGAKIEPDVHVARYGNEKSFDFVRKATRRERKKAEAGGNRGVE